MATWLIWAWAWAWRLAAPSPNWCARCAKFGRAANSRGALRRAKSRFQRGGGAAGAVGFDPNAAPTGAGAFVWQLISFLLLTGVIFAAVKISNAVKNRFAARARAAGVKAEAQPSQEDLQVRQVAQNERMIQLLEQLVAREGLAAKSET